MSTIKPCYLTINENIIFHTEEDKQRKKNFRDIFTSLNHIMCIPQISELIEIYIETDIILWKDIDSKESTTIDISTINGISIEYFEEEDYHDVWIELNNSQIVYLFSNDDSNDKTYIFLEKFKEIIKKYHNDSSTVNYSFID